MAFDAFLRLATADGVNIVIEGESTDKVHAREIEITSFSWGVANASSGGTGGGGGKAVLQDFSFAMATSKASPNLMLACAVGRHIPLAVLTLRRGSFEFLKIRLQDCLVSSYSLAGDNSSASEDPNSPHDLMSINFASIDVLYTVQRTGETVETSFDPRIGT
jgi:type VI secretion system secreted protein Hcp